MDILDLSPETERTLLFSDAWINQWVREFNKQSHLRNLDHEHDEFGDLS